MPYIEIAELAAEKDSGELYLLVNFWLTKVGHDARPNQPLLTNDFVMQLRPTETRVITDANGKMKRASDGVFIDPVSLPFDDQTVWATETVQIPRSEIVATIRQNIKNYWLDAVAHRWTGDHTGDGTKPFYIDGVSQPQGNSKRLARVATDKSGLLTDATIAALRGALVNIL